MKYLDFQIYSINAASPTCLLLAAALPFAHPSPLQVMLLHFSILLREVWLCCQKIQTMVNTALFSIEATNISCYLNGGICSWVLLPDKSSCSACKQKTHLAVVQVYRRYLGKPRLPNRATQSFAYISTNRQDSSGSPSHTDFGLIHPFTKKGKCNTSGVPAAWDVVPPQDFPSQKCCLCTFFSRLSGISPFHLAESAQACWRSFETGCNLFHAFPPVLHICCFPRSCISCSQDDRRSSQQCNQITSWGTELLNLARASCCLPPVFQVVAKSGGGRSGRRVNNTQPVTYFSHSQILQSWH